MIFTNSGHSLAAVAVLFSFSVVPVENADQPKARQVAANQAPRVIPHVRFRKKSKMEIEFILDLNHGKPFKYIHQDGGDTKVAFLFAVLHQGGKRIAGRTIFEVVRPRKPDVRAVDPKSQPLLLKATLDHTYRRLKPGFYELRVVYHIAQNSGFVTKHGVTAANIDETIMYITIN